MVRVRMTNKFSNYIDRSGEVSLKHWSDDSFWVPVILGSTTLMMARRYLVEC